MYLFQSGTLSNLLFMLVGQKERSVKNSETFDDGYFGNICSLQKEFVRIVVSPQ